MPGALRDRGIRIAGRGAAAVGVLIALDLGVRRAPPAPGRRPPRRRAQGEDRRRAGERRHPREMGSAGVRPPAGDAPGAVGGARARGRRADRVARIVVSVRPAPRARPVRARLPHPGRAPRPARLRDADAVRRGDAAGAAPRQVSLQHRADDERRGRRHRQLRQGVPDAVRRVHPVLRRDSLVHEAGPRGVELQPRQRARRPFRCRWAAATTGWAR